jgi:hypothetical protein
MPWSRNSASTFSSHSRRGGRLGGIEHSALDELLARHHSRGDQVVDSVGVVHLGVEHGNGVAASGTRGSVRTR